MGHVNNGPYYKQMQPNPVEVCEDRCGVAGRKWVKWSRGRPLQKEGFSHVPDLGYEAERLTHAELSGWGT